MREGRGNDTHHDRFLSLSYSACTAFTWNKSEADDIDIDIKDQGRGTRLAAGFGLVPEAAQDWAEIRDIPEVCGVQLYTHPCSG